MALREGRVFGRPEQRSRVVIAVLRGPVGGRAVKTRAPARAAVDWLHLAAAPTFAVMALLTAVFDGHSVGMLCSGVRPMSPLTGMLPMYVLMSVFHSGPWLRLVFGRPRT
jgi:hypothetical protein